VCLGDGPAELIFFAVKTNLKQLDKMIKTMKVVNDTLYSLDNLKTGIC
jgi:hypothetical protein